MLVQLGTCQYICYQGCYYQENLASQQFNFIKSSFTNVFLSGVTITHVVKNLMESMWAGSSVTKLKLTHPRELQVYDQATWKKL
jgi:hypothetical protein